METIAITIAITIVSLLPFLILWYIYNNINNRLNVLSLAQRKNTRNILSIFEMLSEMADRLLEHSDKVNSKGKSIDQIRNEEGGKGIAAFVSPKQKYPS